MTWVAIYVVHAAFWLWLAWEAKHDRPKNPSRLAEALWRYEALAIRFVAWTALVLSTVWLFIFLAHVAR